MAWGTPVNRYKRRVPQRAIQKRAPQPDRDQPEARKPQTTYRNNTGQSKQGSSFGLQRSPASTFSGYKGPLDNLASITRPNPLEAYRPNPNAFIPRPGPKSFGGAYAFPKSPGPRPMPGLWKPSPWQHQTPQTPATPSQPPSQFGPGQAGYDKGYVSNTIVSGYREGTTVPAANGGTAQLVRVGPGYDDVAWTTAPADARGNIAVIDESGGALSPVGYTYADAYGAIAEGQGDPNDYGGSDVGNVRNYVDEQYGGKQWTYARPDNYSVYDPNVPVGQGTAGAVGHSMVPPGVDPAVYAQQVQDFWTPEQMQAAQGMPLGNVGPQMFVPPAGAEPQFMGGPQGGGGWQSGMPAQEQGAKQGWWNDGIPNNNPNNQGQGGGGWQGGVPAGGGQGGGQAPAPAPPKPGTPTLPLDPAFEAGRRELEDQLSGTLASLGVSKKEIEATVALWMARLEDDRAEALTATDEAANARGIYNSGIRFTDRGEVYEDFQRAQQDFAAQIAAQRRQLALAQGGAYQDYIRGLQGLSFDTAHGAIESGWGGSTAPLDDLVKKGPSKSPATGKGGGNWKGQGPKAKSASTNKNKGRAKGKKPAKRKRKAGR